MELDEFKLAWQTLDRRLEQQHAMQLNLFRETKLSKVRSGLRMLRTGQVIQIACGALLMLLFAPFWIEHLDVLHLALCGLLLHAYGLMLVLFAARDLALIGGIDYAAPVLDIQRRLETLRAWRTRSALWFGITGCFIWVPLMLVVFYWLGADVWMRNPDVVAWLVASSVVSLAVLFGIVDYVWYKRQLAKLTKFASDDREWRQMGRSTSNPQLGSEPRPGDGPDAPG